MVLHTNWGFSSLTEFTVSFTFNHKQISDWIFFLFVFFFLFGQLQQFWYHGSVVVTRGRWEGWHLQLMVSENDEIKSGLERSGNNKHNNYNNNNTGL